jgi:hypothetical protein
MRRTIAERIGTSRRLREPGSADHNAAARKL